MTNGAIAVTLRNAQNLASILGKETPSNWTDIANNITILVDPSSNILLEFDGFNGTTAVKQADVRSPLSPLASIELNFSFSAGCTPHLSFPI